MPETAKPYVLRSWSDAEWINDVPEGLYPRRMPARFHLGTGGGCQWDGPGYFYEPFGSTQDISLVKRVYSSSALKTAGNRPRPEDVRTALYRLRDRNGALLYVGISSAPLRRWMEHAADKHWWRDVSDLSMDWFGSRPEALAAERAAIRAEKPTYNVMHNDSATA